MNLTGESANTSGYVHARRFSRFYSVCLDRPLGTLTLYVGAVLFGLFAWHKLPVELMPDFEGEKIYVHFSQNGVAPDTLEQEILVPLQKRVRYLDGITETRGEIKGNVGRLEIDFRAGVDLKGRALELQNILAELRRDKPPGTSIELGLQNLSVLSRFVMSLEVTGSSDLSILRNIIDSRIQDSLTAVPGVSRILVVGAGQKEVTVMIDLRRCSELQIAPQSIIDTLETSFQGFRSLGQIHGENHRVQVVINNTIRSLADLRNTVVDRKRGIKLHSVAEVFLSEDDRQGVYRVNGQETIGIIIFKDDSANLLETGQALHSEVLRLSTRLASYGIDLRKNFDASNLVSTLIIRLKWLALLGFFIALFVLYVFLRQIHAVLTVAVAIPISLLIAGVFLFLTGQSLNIITLFGLSIGIGMLMDNSVVVYEAVTLGRERGMSPRDAAIRGLQRTSKAIIAATVTNIVVLIPLLMFVEDVMIKQLAKVIVLAIVLPLLASLLVACTLVPLLAKLFSEMAFENRRPRAANVPKRHKSNLSRDLFATAVKMSLREPVVWSMRLALVVIVTVVFALPVVWLRAALQAPTEATEVKFEFLVGGGRTIESVGQIFARLENVINEQPSIRKTESYYFEDEGSLTVYLESASSDQENFDAVDVREEIDAVVRNIKDFQIKQDAGGNGQASFALDSDGVFRVDFNGDDMDVIKSLATNFAEKLSQEPYISDVSLSNDSEGGEKKFSVDQILAAMYRIDTSVVLEQLEMSGREGSLLRSRYVNQDGETHPVRVVQGTPLGSSSIDKYQYYGVGYKGGAVPLGNLVESQEKSTLASVNHRNGRREISVYFRIPQTQYTQMGLQNVREEMSAMMLPSGYQATLQTPPDGGGRLSRVYLPAMILLVAVLVLTFESLALPFLILLTVPLTLVGAVWGLFWGGFGFQLMALVGVIVLFGLAVNPAILLVERMQQSRCHGSRNTGAIVMRAVRERARPVVMTAATTIGGVWPLTLSTGREMEIWPAFAAVLMGGVVVSTALTLIAIPVGYVLIKRIERSAFLLNRWQWLLWILLSALPTFYLIQQGYLQQWQWQLISGTAIACLAFIGVSRVIRISPSSPTWRSTDTQAPSLESRFVYKVYNQPGPFKSIWLRYRHSKLDKIPAVKSLVEACILQAIGFGLVISFAGVLTSVFWRLVFYFAAGALFMSCLISLASLFRPQLRPLLLHWLLLSLPWTVLLFFSAVEYMLPLLAGQTPAISIFTLSTLTTCLVIFQYGQYCATRIHAGSLSRSTDGKLSTARNLWRSFCVTFLSFDGQQKGFVALHNVNFTISDTGMVGLLGPNGAGKSTFLRIVASILKPTVGTLRFNQLDHREWRDRLAQFIGYLPQSFGLYNHMSASEYLEYFAILYRVGTKAQRQERIHFLLSEVGLDDRKNEKLGGFSGGMRQRVAIARTLLHLPPLLVVDEPTVGLDSRERIRFRNLLAKLARERIVLLSTHVVEDVAISCHRTIVLNAGRVVYDGSPQNLADIAEGKIWSLTVSEKDAAIVKQSCTVISRVVAAGAVRMRILSDYLPHPEARTETPNLEDGYLCLLSK